MDRGPTDAPAPDPNAVAEARLDVGIRIFAYALFSLPPLIHVGVSQLGYLWGHKLGECAGKAGDCRSGKLLRVELPLTLTALMGGGICSTDCRSDAECGPNLRCLSGSCAPLGDKALGEPCGAPWECKAGLCLLVETGVQRGSKDLVLPRTHCSESCGESEACPAGYECGDIWGGRACVPQALAPDVLDLLKGALSEERAETVASTCECYLATEAAESRRPGSP
jgi:hypothetical protein